LISVVLLVDMQVGKGVLTYVSQEVKHLYNLIENEFHPLDLAAKVQPHMLKLLKLSDKLPSASPVPEVQLEQYVPALEKLTTLRVLQQAVVHRVTIYHDIITFFLFFCPLSCYVDRGFSCMHGSDVLLLFCVLFFLFFSHLLNNIVLPFRCLSFHSLRGERKNRNSKCLKW
jgi:hypothetical protein